MPHADKPSEELAALEKQLDARDMAQRLRALRELKRLADRGAVAVEAPRPWVNMHCHSFYSYNAHGYSPSHVAWEMYRRGVSVAAVIDFDVLDAVEEVLAASDALLYRFCAGVESRVYVEEFRNVVINSPDEPGIAYYCGQGFVGRPAPGSDGERVLATMVQRAAERNRAMVARINAYLGDVQVDYDKEVISLSAAGNATERHILEAYERKALEVFPDRARRALFWAARLKVGHEEMERLIGDSIRLRNMMRTKLMKYGGPGYAPPEPALFPRLEEMVAMIRSCGAMPMYAWLDGTNPGEEDTELVVDFAVQAGAVGINLIPDRNFNIRDGAEKERKVRKLEELMRHVTARGLVLNVGTEMNSPAQPLVDHFDAPELRPHVSAFLEGAQIVWGHSLLLRHGGFGYLSPQAQAAFGSDVGKKNAFFRDVGSRPVPHGAQLARLRAASKAGDVRGVLNALSG